jgi:hypothetical protein
MSAAKRSPYRRAFLDTIPDLVRKVIRPHGPPPIPRGSGRSVFSKLRRGPACLNSGEDGSIAFPAGRNEWKKAGVAMLFQLDPSAESLLRTLPVRHC